METKKENTSHRSYSLSFRLLLASEAVNRFGDSIDAIAMSWLVYEVSGSASLTAFNYAVNYIPSIFFTPFCGSYADRHDQKRILVTSDFARFIVIASVAIFGAFHKLTAPYILVSTFLISTIEAFHQPCTTAIVPLVLNQEDYANGQSSSQATSAIAGLIGTAVAGSIISLKGAWFGVFIDSLCFLISAVLLSGMAVAKRNTEVTSKSNMTREGISYLLKNKRLVFLCCTAVLINALSVPYFSLQSVAAEEILKQGPQILSVFGAAIAIGSVFGALLYPKAKKAIRMATMIILCFVSIGTMYLMIINKGKYITIILPILMFLLGIFTSLINTSINVTILTETEVSYLARVSALLQAACVAGNPVASGIISFALLFTSASTVFAITGIISILTSFILAKYACSLKF